MHSTEVHILKITYLFTVFRIWKVISTDHFAPRRIYVTAARIIKTRFYHVIGNSKLPTFMCICKPTFDPSTYMLSPCINNRLYGRFFLWSNNCLHSLDMWKHSKATKVSCGYYTCTIRGVFNEINLWLTY